MSSHVLAVDQGTTGTTALVVCFPSSAPARVVGRGYAEFPQHFPQPGWVEHDLDEIWRASVRAIRSALAQAEARIDAVGVTNQRETSGLWDLAGRPAARALVWQDRRTVDRCEALREAGYEELVRARTGLVLDPYFSGTKLAWLLDQGLRARAERGELRFGTIDSWVMHQLSGGRIFKTDATNAGRTLMMNIHEGSWDLQLIELLGGVPEALLPEICDSAGPFGVTHGLDFLPDGVPITGVLGDQHAALFGQGCFDRGSAKCTYGTGAFALVNTGDVAVHSDHGLLTTLAWQLDGRRTYALEGSAFVAGAIVQWLRDGLGFFESSAEVEALARSVQDSGGVTLVPALTGLGAPYWRPEARGALVGLTRGTTRAHIARAALEGMAMQVGDLLAAMAEDLGAPLRHLRVDGGAAANDLLMQDQADVLGIEIHRPAMLESTALGAAFVAALGAGILADLDQVGAAWQEGRRFRPQRSISANRRKAWRDAVAHA